MRLLNIKYLEFKIIDYDQKTDDFIMDIIKRYGFVEILKGRKLYYRLAFTMLELIWESDKNAKHIRTIKISHDIESTVNRQVKGCVIANKVFDLADCINYFNRI